MARQALSAALLLLACSGCYRAHDRDGTTEPADPPVWSDIVTVFEPDGARPVLQGWDHDVVAFDRSFVVLWIFNRGQLGIAMARFDWDGTIVVPPVELLPAMPPLDGSPSAILGVRLADETLGVYWQTRVGELVWLCTSIDGRVLEGPEVARDDLATDRFGLAIVSNASERFVSVQRDAPTLLPLADDGRLGEPRVVFRRPDGEPWFALVDFRDRAWAVWSDRMPGGPDSVLWASVDWDGSGATEPRERLRGDVALATHPFVADGAVWVEILDFESSALHQLEPPGGTFTITDAPNRGTRWAPTDGEVLGVTAEADDAFTTTNRLVFRRVDPSGASVLETTPVVDGDCRTIEGYDTAADEALAVTWVDHCDVRRLHARVRRPR